MQNNGCFYNHDFVIPHLSVTPRKPRRSIFREIRFPCMRTPPREMFLHKRRKKRNTFGRTECVTLGTATHNPVRAIMSRAPLDTTRYRANNFLRLANVNLKKSNVRYITLLRTNRRERPTKSERFPHKIPTCLLGTRDAK